MLRAAKVLLVFISIASISYGQKGTHTPYSIFGLGELRQNDYAPFLSMGGVSMASTDSTMLNPANPASFSYIGRFRPIFQIGTNGRFSTFENSTTSTKQRHFGLNQFQFGVPIKKRWGAAIGLKPYSFKGYFVSDYTVDDGDSTELRTSEGSGGINKFYLGVAYRPLQYRKDTTKAIWRKDSSGTKFLDTISIGRGHHLSIGANINYLFGSSTETRTFQYASASQGLNSRVNNSLRFSDMIFDFGLNYQFIWNSSSSDGKIQRGNSISVGATYSPAINVRAYQDLFSYSYINIGGFNGSEILSDTVEFIRDNIGFVHVPESYKVGFEYRIGPNSSTSSSLLRIGVDARFQTWSTYTESFGTTAYNNLLKDRLQMGIGLEWTPVSKTEIRTPFLSKAHYRLGFNYTMTELQYQTSLTDYEEITS